MGEVPPLEVLGQVTGSFMRCTPEHRNSLHAVIAQSGAIFRSMTIRHFFAKSMSFSVMLLAMGSAGAADNVSLQALFKDKAIIMVDGARHVLNSGEQGPDGIRLVATDTQEEKAEIEIEGKREVLRLGMVSTGLAPKSRASVVLYPEPSGHYFAEGLINGVRVRFMVDTGSTIIGMSSITADRIGIDYRKLGRPGYVNTASGTVPSYHVKLASVKVGDITLHDVDAGILEGSSPRETLLGMSFLGHLNMRRDYDKLELLER